MSDRFQKLFQLRPNLYQKDCPVLITAGALHKDMETDKVLAQIRMKNIGNSTIDSCKISIKAYENNGEEIDGITSFSYLDLNSDPDTDFGMKVPVFLPNRISRSFSVQIVEVVSKDKSVLTFDSAECFSLPEHMKIADLYGDPDLVEQYAIDVGGNCEYVPQNMQGLFMCTCGTINLDSVSSCRKCGRTFSQLASCLDEESLRQKAIARKEKAAQEKEEQSKKELYENARQKLNKGTVATHNEAIRELESLGDWGNAKELLEKSKLEIPKIEKREAEEQKELKNRRNRIKRAILVAAIIAICIVSFCVINAKIIKPSNQYNAAMELYNEGEYKEALTIFESLNGYKDSEKQVLLCDEMISEEIYNQANECFLSGDYERAIELLTTINDYKDSRDKLSLYKYELAKQEINKKDYITAYELLNGLGYEDSDELLKEIEPKYQLLQTFSDVTKDSMVSFGSFEQDNNKNNGKEPIQWRVLDRKDNRILMLSEKALDLMYMEEDQKDPTWETCKLRSWLNNDFLKKAFSDEERSLIQTTELSDQKNPDYNTKPGNKTKDKVFLLSATDVESYFTSSSDRKCEETEKARSRRLFGSDKTNYDTEWWTRSPGEELGYWVTVYYDGDIKYGGVAGNNNARGVRPAIWINLDSI